MCGSGLWLWAVGFGRVCLQSAWHLLQRVFLGVAPVAVFATNDGTAKQIQSASVQAEPGRAAPHLKTQDSRLEPRPPSQESTGQIGPANVNLRRRHPSEEIALATLANVELGEKTENQAKNKRIF